MADLESDRVEQTESVSDMEKFKSSGLPARCFAKRISSTDGRWLDMGLNMPGTVELPEAVDGVMQEPSAAGARPME